MDVTNPLANKCLAIVSFVLWSMCSVACAADYTIELNGQATVATDAEVVRLNDIANISGLRQIVCEKLGRLDIEAVPASDNPVAVTVEQVQFRLRLAGIPVGVIDVRGPTVVVRAVTASRSTSQTAVHRDASHQVETVPGEFQQRAGQRSVLSGSNDVAPVSSQRPQRQQLTLAESQSNARYLQLRSQLLRQIEELNRQQDNVTSTSAIQTAAFHTDASPEVVTVSHIEAPEPMESLTSQQRIEAAACAVITDRLPWDRENLEITVSHVGLRSTTSDLVERARLQAELQSQWPPLGRVQVVVHAQADDGSHSEIPVVLNVKHFQNVVVSRQRIARGARVTADDVYLDRQEVRDLASIQTRLDAVVGNVAVRDIAPLQLIRPTDVHEAVETVVPKAIVIKRSETVRFVAPGGPVSISVAAEAMQDGHVGDVIRVRNLDSKKVMTGRVVNNREVEAIYQ